jgi:hypothetical protein
MQFLPGGNIMQQPPYEQWQQWQPSTQYPPYQSPSQVVFMQPSAPAAKPKNENMKTFSILSFIAFIVLCGLGILTTGGLGAAAVGAVLGCGGLMMFAAGFIFLCLI